MMEKPAEEQTPESQPASTEPESTPPSGKTIGQTGDVEPHKFPQEEDAGS